MPRVKKALSSKEVESYAGKGVMVQFVKRKRSRPKTRRTPPPVPFLSPVVVHQGIPPTVQRRSPPPAVQHQPAPDVPDDPSKSMHVPCTNWGAKPYRTRMEKSLPDWKYLLHGSCPRLRREPGNQLKGVCKKRGDCGVTILQAHPS